MKDFFSTAALCLEGNPDSGFIIREHCGLDHEVQILPVTGLPQSGNGDPLSLRDLLSGAILPVQRSLQDPDTFFVQLELKAWQEYRLVPQREAAAPRTSPVKLERPDNSSAVISNGKWTAEILPGEYPDAIIRGAFPPGPVRKMSVAGGGPNRGTSFLDTREAVRKIVVTVLEEGPLRVVVRYRADIGESHHYTARMTFDAGLDFIRVDEEFDAGAGDQIVWDFSGPDLPDRLHKLDSTAGFTSRSLHYVFDRRHARLACWNQFSQLHDFSDGYVLAFPGSSDAIGCVALDGGKWLGNSLNFLEAWERRWMPGDPASRRLVPADAKADAAPSPERIASRPANQCEPHFSFEGWIHRGRRSFALLLAPEAALRNQDWSANPPIGHFDQTLARDKYRQQQSLPRRIQVQHGTLPLAGQLAACFEWPVEESMESAKSSAVPPWKEKSQTISSRTAGLMDFVQARVFGFWEGSGSAYTNPVVSRRLAREDLIDWEWLRAHGHLSQEQQSRGRAWFAFLCHLFASDNYYPGGASMDLGGPGASLEPAMAGMANQNFYTDVFNMPGLAAQVFHGHPDAALWRETFAAMWKRQLEYHVYPESGVWEESHTYFQHVLITVLPTLERRRDDGVEDGFADPVFQRVASSLPAMHTPRDAVHQGKRHIIAFGDHGVDVPGYAPIYRELAANFAPHNAELASQLAWIYQELGGTEAVPVTPKEFPWQSGYLQGMGYFFRNRDARGESMLALRSGSAWGHHHNDEGSIHFYAAGRSWIVDSAFSYYQENGARKVRADGHSRWVPRDFFPLNYLWQFNRGWITEHAEGPAFPYATAFTPIFMGQAAEQLWHLASQPIMHWRVVVQMAHSAFLILDWTDGSVPHDNGCLVSPNGPQVMIPQLVRFHVPCDAPLALEDATAESSGSPCHLRIRSLFGARPPELRSIDRASHDKSFATREICYEIPGGSLAAFLVMIEDTGSPTLSVESEGAFPMTLRHAEFDARLEIDPAGKVNIENLRTKISQEISFRHQPGSGR